MFLNDVSAEVTIPEALLHTVVSMSIVFVVLIMISFCIYLLKFVPALLAGGAKKTEASAPVKKTPEPAVQAVPAAAQIDEGQIAAVIAAAVAAQMEAESGVPVAADGLVIRSIKKRSFSN